MGKIKFFIKKVIYCLIIMISTSGCTLWHDKMIVKPQEGVFGLSLVQIITDIDNNALDQKIKFYDQNKFKKKKLTANIIHNNQHFFIFNNAKINKELLSLISEDF